MLNKNKNFFGVQRPDRDVNPSGEGLKQCVQIPFFDRISYG